MTPGSKAAAGFYPGTFGVAGFNGFMGPAHKPGDDFIVHYYESPETLNFHEFGCYMLHFDKPVKGCRHYIGWAPDIVERFKKHLRGEGSQLTRLAVKLGIVFRIVRVWPLSELEFEQELKARKEGPRLCFLCNKPRKRSPRKSRGGPKGCPG